MRQDNWPQTLAEVVRVHQGQPYRWGRFDCITFAADCIGAVTGRNYMAAIQQYDCETGAARALLATGHRSAYQFFRANFEPLAPALLAQGDVGFVRADGAGLAGPAVVLGDVAIARDHSGWQRLSLQDLNYGFKVG